MRHSRNIMIFDDATVVEYCRTRPVTTPCACQPFASDPGKRNMETATEVLVPLLALYGATLSTYVCYKNIQANRPKLFVTHGWSYDIDKGGSFGWFPTTLNLYAVNQRQREVVVSSFGLELPDSNVITPPFLDISESDGNSNNKYDVEDKRLQYGDRIEIVFDYRKLLDRLHGRNAKLPLRVRAVCEDSLENFYFSTRFEIGNERRRQTVR